jgi:hypothetical protein
MKPLKKLRVTLITASILIAISSGTSASASIATGNIFADIIAKQKENLFGLIPVELFKYVGQNGQIKLESSLKNLSKQALEMVKATGAIAFKTAGDQAADINQDTAEVAQQANTKSTGENAKFFEDNAGRVENITTENETGSESSLEAADKANKLSSTNITTNQQLTKSTLDLATAQQNANAIAIQKGQQARTERLKAQIDSAYYENESERLQAVMTRRFYPNAAGEMVEGKPDATTRVFNKK